MAPLNPRAWHNTCHARTLGINFFPSRLCVFALFFLRVFAPFRLSQNPLLILYLDLDSIPLPLLPGNSLGIRLIQCVRDRAAEKLFGQELENPPRPRPAGREYDLPVPDLDIHIVSS